MRTQEPRKQPSQISPEYPHYLKQIYETSAAMQLDLCGQGSGHSLYEPGVPKHVSDDRTSPALQSRRDYRQIHRYLPQGHQPGRGSVLASRKESAAPCLLPARTGDDGTDRPRRLRRKRRAGRICDGLGHRHREIPAGTGHARHLSVRGPASSSTSTAMSCAPTTSS